MTGRTYAFRQTSSDKLARALLVVTVCVGVNVADGQAFDALFFELARAPSDLVFVKRKQYTTVNVQAFAHGKTPLAWNQWHGLLQEDVVLIVTAFRADFDRVTKSLRGQ
jgi:hypothetical protein